MQFVRAIGRGFAWIATVLGLGSLAADMLKRWLEHNGYLDHPDQVIAQILSVATTLVEQRWFYPALTFVMGLAIGLSFDALARRISGEAESRRKILGYDMMKMADSLKERAGYWPMDFRDLRPSIDSLLIRSERERIYSPGEYTYELISGQKTLAIHFEFVGSYLVNGHVDVARRYALKLRDEVYNQRQEERRHKERRPYS